MRTDRERRSLDLRKPVAGVVIALLALLLWSNRDAVSAWFATAYTASIRLTTMTEVDDTRLERIFAVVQPSGASLEPIPGLRQIRNSVVHVPGPTRAAALATADTVSHALVAAFDAEGHGHLTARVSPRADPAPGPASKSVLAVLTFAAPLLALCAIPLVWSGWRQWRTGFADRLPRGADFAAAGGLMLAIGVFVMPGWLVMALFAMAIPVAIAGTIVYAMRNVRRAARWPSAQARIVRSRLQAVRRKQGNGSTTVSNAPDIEYAFSVDGIEYKGQRISIGSIDAGSPEAEATLGRYQVGRTVPVYYNPRNPQEAVLERDPPVRPATMYAIALAVLLAGFAVVITFTRVADIIDWLEPWFPPGAFVPGALFFAVAGAVLLLSLLANRRMALQAARWPTTAGTVLSSATVSRRVLAPGRGGQRMEVWAPLVEFSYRVGGRDYHGARVAFGPDVVGARALAEATVARYPAGDAVTVHYDPANPSLAVLETHVAFGWLGWLLAAAFFAAAVFFSGWRGLG